MNVQDTNYNLWINTTYEEVKTTFSGFGVPDDAIIDDIQIKMRIKSSTSGWTWYVHGSNDNGATYFPPKNCVFYGVCSYNTGTVFNSISFTYPTMSWLNNNSANIVTGSDINSGKFSLKIWQSPGTKSTDIDVLLFNIRYHVGSVTTLPSNVYQVAQSFFAGPAQSPGIGQVFYHWDFSIPYAGGKVLLSSTPDGSGSLEFADKLTLVNTSLNSAVFTYNAAPSCALQHAISPIDVTSYFLARSSGTNNGYIRLNDFCGRSKDIQPIYLVILPIPSPTLSPIPTPTITPMPTTIPAPTPFLDLPWDYEGKRQTFQEAALSMTSFFDHEYPLLSSGLSEDDGKIDESENNEKNTLRKYEGSLRGNAAYSSHDGYDYARLAKVNIGDPVLSAAAGIARYVSSCGACGNMIVIDHENGYQTRYLHMQKEGLIVATPGVSVSVGAHQQIGKVGATGRVSPPGDDGAHIHFGVFQDRNHDGNFDDNIPDGATDPFGWQGTDPDPWEMYSFVYGGKSRTGNRSYYLWKHTLEAKEETLTSSGGTFTSGKFSVIFPPGATLENLLLDILPEPILSPSATLSSLGTTVSLSAKDSLGNMVSTFQLPFTLISDFSSIDLSRYDPTTISFYSSNDGINWTKEVTQVDLNQKSASTTLSHFTHFALMAQRIDTIPPVTTLSLNGSTSMKDWYKTPVIASLSATDNQGGLGIDYTVFKTDQGDWETYINSLTLREGGVNEISFYSADKDENIEEQKTVQIHIDNTPPVLTASVSAGEDPYVLGTWTNKDIKITFSCSDALSGVATVSAPMMLRKEGENQHVKGNCIDKAGNSTDISIDHINIDKTRPKIILFTFPKFLWPANGKMVPVHVIGKVWEKHLLSKTFRVIDEYHLIEPVLSDFGLIKLEAKRKGSDFDGRVYIIKVEAVDKAGNKSTKETKVMVPHDERRDEKRHHEKEK